MEQQTPQTMSFHAALDKICGSTKVITNGFCTGTLLYIKKKIHQFR